MQSVIEAPTMLDFPEKMLPILDADVFNKYDYFLFEGGRSSSKSQTIARFLLYLGDQQKLRIVCGREIQKNIDESVYNLLADLIREYDLAYQILADEIRHYKTGTTFNFRGFRDQGKQNIKGLEGVDILWVEEAQAITKGTLEIIIPTIRKMLSKVIWSMNRYEEDDPVFNYFWKREDCLHIHINYLDNQHCPQKMIKEAHVCRQESEEDYNHVWLGIPRKVGSTLRLCTPDMFNALKGIHFNRPMTKRIFSGDPSLGGDECVGYIIDENGRKLDTLILHERDTMKIAALWVAFARRSGVRDYIIDRIGFKGIGDRIRELDPGCNMQDIANSEKSSSPKEYINLRAEIYMYTQKEIIDKRVEYFDDPIMIKQLTNIYIKPLNSRLLKIESKDDIKKRILRSPDRADAYVNGIWGLQHATPLSEWKAKKDAYNMEDDQESSDWRAM